MDTGLPEGWAQIADNRVKRVFTKLIAALAGGYHKQHNTNDTHSTITATGKISERNRSVPFGERTALSLNTAWFTAPTGSTWTVTPASFGYLTYALVGRLMTIDFSIVNSQVSVAAAASVRITLPVSATLLRATYGTFAYNDNGTAGTGVLYANPDAGTGTYLQLMKDLKSTTWSVSAALTLAGQITVEVAETV